MNQNVGKISFKRIIFQILLLLLTGHACLEAYAPNSMVVFSGLILIILILGYILMKERNEFAYIISIFICSHFNYGDFQGGVWTISNSIILAFYYLFIKTSKKIIIPSFLNTVLFLFIFFDILGLIVINESPLIVKLEGFIQITSYFLIFNLCANQIVNKDRIKILILSILVISAYMCFVAFNQKFLLFQGNSPLIPTIYEQPGMVSVINRSMGTIGDYELFAEYSSLMIALCIPFVIFNNIRIKMVYLYFILAFNSINLLLTVTRSSFILTIILLSLFSLWAIMKIKIIKFFKIILVLFSIISILLIFKEETGLNNTIERIKTINLNKLSFASITSGQEINRSATTRLAVDRLNEQNWFLGYGCAPGNSYKYALFEDPLTEFTDYHNLYLTLPVIYGWFGMLFFLIFIFYIYYHIIRINLNVHSNDILKPILLGFVLFFSIFFINEYKICMIRNQAYHMLFWIWCGIAVSIIRNSKNNILYMKYLAKNKKEC